MNNSRTLGLWFIKGLHKNLKTHKNNSASSFSKKLYRRLLLSHEKNSMSWPFCELNECRLGHTYRKVQNTGCCLWYIVILWFSAARRSLKGWRFEINTTEGQVLNFIKFGQNETFSKINIFKFDKYIYLLILDTSYTIITTVELDLY